MEFTFSNLQLHITATVVSLLCHEKADCGPALLQKVLLLPKSGFLTLKLLFSFFQLEGEH